MILSGTGHRSNKIGGYKLPNPTYIKICQETDKILRELKPDKVISGMALGFDSYLASVAIKLGIPLISAIPFAGQECKWPSASQEAYHKLLSKASEIVIVSDGGYSADKMQIRNKYLVDNCDLLLACYNGDKKSGTYNCISYAESINKDIVYINPNDFNHNSNI